MKKIFFIILLFTSFQSFGQRFPSIDSLQTYILRYFRNSTVETFTNLRGQNIVYGTTEFLEDIVLNSGVDSIWIVDGGVNADTLRYRRWSVTYTSGLISGGGSYTFSNGLTNTAGTVRLGGTLTQNTTIAGAGFSLSGTNLSSVDFTAASGTEQGSLFLTSSNPTFGYLDYITSRSHNFSADFDGFDMSATRTGASGFFHVFPDSIVFKPHLGLIHIDTLAAVGVVDTTSNKVVVYNTATKRLQRMAWPSTGGSGVAISDTVQTHTTGTTLTVTNGVNILYINPSTTLATLTITLPATVHPYNEIEIYFGGTITSGEVVTVITISANTGQTLLQASTPSVVEAGESISYKWNSSLSKWFRKS